MRSGTAARAALIDKAELAKAHRSLVARLDLVDALSNRLSHVVGEFEKNTINGVRINAILADSQQHVPLSVQKMLSGQVAIANAARIREKEEVLASLPLHTTKLSPYGEEFTTDMFGQLNATDVASSSDAHFFYLNSITTKSKDSLQLDVKAVKDGIGFASMAAFTFLKESGMKQKNNADYTVKGVGEDGVSNLWLPCYFTAEHFRRGLLHFPDALGRLAFNDPLSYSWLHYQLPFEIFGRSVVQNESKKEIEWTLFLHKTRSLFEFSKVTVNEKDGRSLLRHSVTSLTSFLSHPVNRGKESIRSLYGLVSYAFLIDWRDHDLDVFIQQLYLEIVTRSVRWILKKSGSSLALQLAAIGLASSTNDNNNNNINNNNNNISNNNNNDNTATPWVGAFAAPNITSATLHELLVATYEKPTSSSGSSAFITTLVDIIDKSKQLGKLSSVVSVAEWRSLAHTLHKWKELQQQYGGLQSIFDAVDSSLTEQGGDKKMEALVNHMKSPSTLPISYTPSTPVICATALTASIPFSSSTTATPARITWVQKGAALAIQRAYRKYKCRGGNKRYINLGVEGGLTSSTIAKWWIPTSNNIRPQAILARCVPAVLGKLIHTAFLAKFQEEREKAEREKQESKQAKIIANRSKMVALHPISLPTDAQNASLNCWFCGKHLDRNHIRKVWGRGAEPDDQVLYQQARRNVLASRHFQRVIEIDMHTEKEYRKLGGHFSFPDPSNDTFIKGLHARIIASRVEWGRTTAQKMSHDEAVAELMLRLRWDERVKGAKEKLANIVGHLWAALNEYGPTSSSIPSSIAPDH